MYHSGPNHNRMETAQIVVMASIVYVIGSLKYMQTWFLVKDIIFFAMNGSLCRFFCHKLKLLHLDEMSTVHKLSLTFH